MKSEKEELKQPGKQLKPSGKPVAPQTTNNSEDGAAVHPELLEALGKLIEQAGLQPGSVSWEQTFTAYRGPFPPAEVMREYEQAFKGSGREILRLTAQRLVHEELMQRVQVEGAENRKRLGQWFALGIAVLAIFGGVICHIYTGAWVFPVALVAVGVGGPAAGQAIARSWSKDRRE